MGNGQILKGKQSMSTPPLPPTPRQTDTHQKRPSVFRNFSHPHSPLDCKADDVIMESSGTPLVRDVRHHWRRNAFGTTRQGRIARLCAILLTQTHKHTNTHTATSPGIWRREWKWHVFGGDYLLFYSRHFHSARDLLSADDRE